MKNSRVLWTLAFFITIVGLTVTAQEIGGVVRRQDKNTPSPASTSSTSNHARTITTNEGTSTQEPSKNRKSGTDSSRSTITSTKRTRTAKVPANSPPGGVNLISPAITDGFQVYPIGTKITWSYNYTSLIVSPTAINVEAYCERIQEYYTIAQNYSVAERTVVWDTNEYQSTANQAIAQATYTLFMYDSSKSRTDSPEPGKLYVYNSFQFGMYTPRGRIDWNEYKCDVCSDASSLLQSHSVRVLLGTSFLFAISFAWFVYGAM